MDTYHEQTIQGCYTCNEFIESKMRRGSAHGHKCKKEIHFPVHIFAICSHYKSRDWFPTLRLLAGKE